MRSEELELKMRRGEYFHSLRIPEGMWFVVRLDGRGFTKLTNEGGFKKPFDDEFNKYMMQTASRCMTEFQGIFATTHSDEISILFSPTTDFFDREVEKIVSTTAAFSSVCFSSIIKNQGTFDSRIWMGATVKDVVDYYSWRAEDAVRGAINSYTYWALRQERNMTKRQATKMLLKRGFAWKNEFLFQEFGVNFNETPAKYRRGVGCYWELREKMGFNPIKEEKVKTLRRILHIEDNLPMKDSFRDWLTTNLRLITSISNIRNAFTCDVKQWNFGEGKPQEEEPHHH